jgi:hypothetical protein
MRRLAHIIDAGTPAPLAMTFAAAWAFVVISMWYLG